MCRRAVELGREKLGFDRMGLAFYDAKEDVVNGAFGTDERGETADERSMKGRKPEGTTGWQVIHSKARLVVLDDAPLFKVDDKGELIPVGKGMKSVAALWDGEDAIGHISVDNFLQRRPLTDADNQILVLYAAALGHLVKRRLAEEETRRFNERLTRLHEVGIDLSRIASFDDMCLRAVELGREKLGFDRLGLLFFTKQGDGIDGSFGTDEHGATTDERFIRGAKTTEFTGRELLRTKARLVAMNDIDLGVKKEQGTVVLGKGMASIAGLWDGENIIGYLSTDNLIQHRPITETDNQLLALYAEALGHLVKRKWAEEERAKLETQVQQAQKLESLGVLAGGIAHDFNNLLMAILGNADLALMELSPVSPARECIQEIETAARRAADLAKQMLAYSGKGKFVVRALNLNEVVSEMSHLLEVSISKKAILRQNFAANLPAVEADATQMRQIIMNLITNASEAIGDKSGYIAISTGAMQCDSNYLEGTWLNE